MSFKSKNFCGVGFEIEEQLEAWLITLGFITAIGKAPPCSTSKTYSVTPPTDSSKLKDFSKSTVPQLQNLNLVDRLRKLNFTIGLGYLITYLINFMKPIGNTKLPKIMVCPRRCLY